MNAIYFYKKSQTAVNLVRIVRLLTIARLLANLAAVFWIRAALVSQEHAKRKHVILRWRPSRGSS